MWYIHGKSKIQAKDRARRMTEVSSMCMQPSAAMWTAVSFDVGKSYCYSSLRTKTMLAWDRATFRGYWQSPMH